MTTFLAIEGGRQSSRVFLGFQIYDDEDDDDGNGCDDDELMGK